MTAAPHVAFGDCEALAAGVLGAWQPANATSSLAFVVAGLWLARRARAGAPAQRRIAVAVAGALVTVGIGSAAFHGPGSPTGRWIHDVSIAALLLAVLASDLGDLRGDEQALAAAPGALAVVGGLLLVAPTVSVPVSAVLVGAVVVAEVLVAVRGRAPGRFRSPAYVVAVVALVAGAAVAAASGTGARWCRPDILLQGHALWHLSAAAAVAAWGTAVLRHPAPLRAPR